MDIIAAIRTKRAVRQFEDRPLPGDVVEAIVNAGRLAGSAKNMQPWSFVVIRDRVTLQQLAQCGEWCGHLASAAMGVALVTPDPFLRLTVGFDLGRAAQNMMLAAWELGVGSVMATIYHNNRVAGLLNIPADHVVPWCISFGYPVQDPTQRPARKGQRRPVDEVVHWEKW